MHVVICEFMDENALAGFDDHITVTYDPLLVNDRAKLLETAKGAAAIIVRNQTKIDIELLNACPHLIAVGRLGVGLDNIDLIACKERGIDVYPATGANTLCVAEYVIAATMMLVRRAFRSSDATIAGEWPRGELGSGGEVAGRTIGLFGFGAIARAVAERARALGMTVAAHDPFLPSTHWAWDGIENCSASDLIARSDVLSLHVPLTEKTRNLIGKEELDCMKTGAIIINTARGGIIDEAAVVEALKSGRLGGAALDVFSSEPITSATGAQFKDVPNLIVTPHISGVTQEGNKRVSFVTVQKIAKKLARK